jgi:signal transduction histidine kinase
MPIPSLRRVRRALDPADPFGESQVRITATAARVRLVTGLAAAVVLLCIPAIMWEKRLAVAGMLSGYVIVAEVIERYGDRHGLNTRRGVLLLGMLAIFACTLILPHFLVPMLLAFLVTVVVDTCAAGLAGGMESTCLAIVLALVAQWSAPVDDRVSVVSLVLFGILTLAAALVVDKVTREQRRLALGLERMQHALRSVTAVPGLVPTLDSIVQSVTDAADAKFAFVMLRDGDSLYPAAPMAVREIWPHSQRIDELAGPVRDVMRTGHAIIVDDVLRGDRYARFSDLWGASLAHAGVGAIVALPLRADGVTFGVLVGCFRARPDLGDDDLPLLEGYADQAALVITRAQAYDREHHAAAQLQEADRLKSEFLGTVSHELRTPLTAAKGFVDTVLLYWDRLDDQQRRRMLERASANADELALQIEQLLDLTRIDAGHVDNTPKPTELEPYMLAWLEQIKPILAEHSVDVMIPPKTWAFADPESLKHVMTNLVSNAVKFSEPRSRLEIGASSEGEDVLVWVRDEGVGVAAEDLERIFERFYQSNLADRPRRGTGIGLAIARSFVELQGGDLWVESVVGEGSTFLFTVPVAAPSAEPSETAGDAGVAADREEVAG